MEIKKQIELMFKEKQQNTVVIPSPPKINRTGANYFVCNFEGCGATIKHRRNLIRHWQLHQKACYYCFNCGYQSVNREQITQHHCDPNTPKFECAECEKSFTILQHLNRHLLLIHGVRLFVWCPSCRSYFARIDALKKHQSRCHQSDSIGSSLLTSTSTANRNESLHSISNIASPSKGRNLISNNGDRIISTVISGHQPQSNGRMIGSSSTNLRDENHYMSNTSVVNKQQAQPTIINLNINTLNSTPPTSSNQNNIDENLFRTHALLRNSVITFEASSASSMADEQLQNTLNDNANRIKLFNSNIMLSNNKTQTYMSTGVNVERESNNPFDSAMPQDYNHLYRKKIRFGELNDVPKDRTFKQ